MGPLATSGRPRRTSLRRRRTLAAPSSPCGSPPPSSGPSTPFPSCPASWSWRPRLHHLVRLPLPPVQGLPLGALLGHRRDQGEDQRYLLRHLKRCFLHLERPEPRRHSFFTFS